ncbi:MAG: hypothetical protein ACJAY8_001300 [Sphingobacteriales bacterium]|jgi:hypothetical protein
MKKSFLAFIAVFCSIITIAQQDVDPCGMVEYIKSQMNKNQDYIDGVIRAEKNAQKWMEDHPNSFKNDGGLTIPVVFHVIYNENDASQNIPESTILSQLEVLNKAYRNQDSDAALGRDEFDHLRGDMKINFALASIGPNGNATNGIMRYPVQKDGFDIFTEMDAWKHEATGGADAWPNDLYLNFWVCKLTIFGMENALLGIATFPATMSVEEGNATPAPFDEDGVTVNYRHVGATLDTDIAPNNLGKTAIHEVGHWLGLRHIWADEDDPFTGVPGPCGQDDYVNDTPMCNQRSQGDCNFNRNSCSNENEFSDNFWGAVNPPDMVENYMDYSGDECMHMFTQGQKERAWSFLVTAREKLFGSSGRSGEHFNAYALKTEASCLSGCDGSIDVHAFWGQKPYKYSLDGGTFQAEPLFENVCTGDYNLVIEDNEGTVINALVKVESNYLAPEYTLSLVQSSCASCADGSAMVNITNGVPDYTYSWNTTPVQTNATASGLTPGIYVVTVTDGCGEVTQEEAIIGNSTIEEQIIQFSVFPNPAEDRMVIQGDGQGEYHIYNNMGQLILEGDVVGETTVFLGGLPDGNYLLQLKTKGGVQTKRLVVLK